MFGDYNCMKNIKLQDQKSGMFFYESNQIWSQDGSLFPMHFSSVFIGVPEKFQVEHLWRPVEFLDLSVRYCGGGWEEFLWVGGWWVCPVLGPHRKVWGEECLPGEDQGQTSTSDTCLEKDFFPWVWGEWGYVWGTGGGWGWGDCEVL